MAKNLVKVGKNLSKSKTMVPEYEETKKKLQALHDQKYIENVGASSVVSGPGQYSGIRDWRKEATRRSYNLKLASA